VALTTVPLPYGLRELYVTGYTTDAATVLDTPSVKLPYGRTLSFSAAEEFQELRGDDRVVTTRGQGEGVEWDLEAGGLSYESTRKMFGGSITETGTTPNQKKVYLKKVTEARPFFQLRGRAISDSGGDVVCTLFRCRSTGELEGEMSDGEFWLTSASGVALPCLVAGTTLDGLYQFEQNETAAVLT